MGLADLHIHTIYSYDGTASVPAVLRQARKVGLDVIAITDHDEIRGALEAVELASYYGIEVIPGVEITTSQGDLLALFIKEPIKAGLPLLDTIWKVRDLGGICIAPHPMARGMGMKSLSAHSILKVLRIPEMAETLIALEGYNATALDRASNRAAILLGLRSGLTLVGNSDAHMLEAIGLGATEFEGQSASALLYALRSGQTSIRRQKEWNSLRILSTWALNYLGSTFTRMAMATR